MTLNGRNALVWKKSFYGTHQKNLIEDIFILSAQNVGQTINIRQAYVQIIAEVPMGGGDKRQWVCQSA